MSSSVATPQSVGPDIVSYLEWLVGQAETSEGTAELGDVVEDLCRHYRALGICAFADDGNPNELFQWLLHSPLSRKHYLGSVYAQGKGEPRGGRASFVDPVLDAMAARQWQLATAIGALEAASWLEGEEYEDDFCYGEFLRLTLVGADTGSLLVRWTGVLEGKRDGRLDVATALAGRDARSLEDTLRALIAEADAKARALADPQHGSLLAEDFCFAPNRWVSIEGLALLALAETLGMATDYELEACPSPARRGAYAPFRSRAYPHLEL